jgi:hypothetical protein
MRNKYLNNYNGGKNENQTENLIDLPARIDAWQTARLLGFQERDIAVLISLKLLKPLGKPVPNSIKYFATCEIEALAENPEWLHDATQAIYDYWKERNKNKSSKTFKLVAVEKQEIPLAA